MAGSLLVSGNPQHYKAIGESGQPVYSVAFQLREAIRLKAGASVANCLAIPQTNQHGSMVDWYAPVAGDVVPWSAATSEEREHALSRLDVAHRALERVIAQMSQSPSRDHQAEREKNTVLPLMSKVFYFPDTNFIYLVNGEPVIAFWGFHSEGSTLPADPFTNLRKVASPIAAAPEVAPKKRAWWWWLLLLLLLLLLLFFLLRACAPGVLPVAIQPTPSVSPEGRSVSPVIPSSPLLPGTPSTPLNQAKPENLIDQGTSLLRRWWPGSSVGTNQSGPDAVSGNNLVDTTGAPTETLNETPSGTAPEVPVDAAGRPDGQVPGQSPGPNPADVTTPPGNTPPVDPTTSSQPSPPVTPLGGDIRNPSNQAGPQQGRPLTIPPQALNSGNTGFLEGSWTAGTGIQDAKTGKPLRMEYDFSQGNGQGKVTIRRADDSQCVGAVSAQMQNKNLQISDRGVAKCSDGGTIALPKVTCTPQADGRADCQGRYENGTTFPVSMRHSPK